MRHLLIVISLLLGLMAFSQKTTRSRLKAESHCEPAAVCAEADTLFLDSAMVKVSGYEKALRSTVESFFVTNNTNDSISMLSLIFEYQDMSGRQLHQRTETIKLDLPPYSTRMARIPSWDKQKVWYYYLTVPTKTRTYQSTPYRITIIPTFALK